MNPEDIKPGMVHGDYVLTGELLCGLIPVGVIREGLPNAGVRVYVHSAVKITGTYA